MPQGRLLLPCGDALQRIRRLFRDKFSLFTKVGIDYFVAALSPNLRLTAACALPSFPFADSPKATPRGIFNLWIDRYSQLSAIRDTCCGGRDWAN